MGTIEPEFGCRTCNVQILIAALADEHNALVRQKAAQDLSRSEQLRLNYVRWQLDRIDDALYGESLDLWENAVEQYEQFASDIGHLLDRLEDVRPSKKRRR